MKKYLIKYKWQNFLLFLLLVLTSGVSTGYAFLQMYIGKQVMEGNFRMVLITVQYRFDFWQQYFVLYSK